jgi:alpha-tubulin suppressor-like RCC1 family protein
MHIAPSVGSRLAGGLVCASIAVFATGCTGTTEQQGPFAARLGFAVAPPVAATNGAPLAPAPVVQLQDAQGAPVALQGRLIVAAVTPVGTSLSGITEVRTDIAGKAAFTGLTISGTVGAKELRFESAGLATVTAAPLQLAAGTAATFAVAGGNLQTAQAGSDVAALPTVLIADATGNPVPGAAVLFTVTGGGGTLAGGATVTGADGRAAPTRWTLGTNIGLNTLSATTPAVPGVTLEFTATGVQGPPAILTIVTGDGQTAIVGLTTTIAPSVKLTDALGHPLANVAVSFAVTAGGGVLSAANPLTDASGIATLGSWSLGLAPGVNTITASRAGVPSVTFTATGIDFPLSVVDAGGEHSCGVDAAGAAYCWGANGSGQIGNGATVDVNKPTAVGGGLVFTSITTGLVHSCGLVAGAAYCWGSNSTGQLGDGTQISRSLPVPVAGGFTFTELEAGFQFTCGVQANGAARCWGFNGTGQLGDGTLTNRLTPTLVADGHVFAGLSAGSAHTCALEGTNLFCWGSNGQGRLGDGTSTNRLVPTAVSGALSFMSVATGDSYTCAITAAGAGYCWGSGSFGFLGTGNLTSQVLPTPISGSLVLAGIHSSGGHTCARTTTGQGYCWGFNGSGELGDGSLVNRLVPTAVLGGATFTSLRAGADHTCGLGASGSTYCWGKNSRGAVGDGTNFSRLRPGGVIRP